MKENWQEKKLLVSGQRGIWLFNRGGYLSYIKKRQMTKVNSNIYFQKSGCFCFS